ncbi:transcription factor GTE9-like isoform X2 [Hibiscus syriacus]|uniref:transcription factor GTE9-like isoform X2 n=1 Tax=Hibiscus syriacus TaxID=106335 RepID=UPI0019241D30|nr:transcription factor GTE9-like isoform X2 [Hibiscus syriacus]
MQQGRGDDQGKELVDSRGNEPPVSSYPPKETEETCLKSIKSANSGSSRDSGSVDGEAVAAKASSPVGSHKVLEAVDSGTQFDEKTSVNNPLDRNKYVCFDQLEQTSQAKSSSVESDCHQDGESAPAERQVSPEKLYRAAILKNRFADTILKAREKTLTAQGENVDPEQLRREREELEHLSKKEARLLAEAKAAEDAQRRAEAEAAAEARRKRELERDATRQALLKIEKTVEINENSRFRVRWRLVR